MKSLILLFLLAVPLVSKSQTFSGRVLDKETNKPIAYAVVYYNGTSTATYTDDDGYFKLVLRPDLTTPVTVSAMGYFSIELKDRINNQNTDIYLEPKIFEYKEVTIKSKADINSRIKNLELFKKEFLGRTKNSRECEILNEDDIRFKSSLNKDTISAYAIKPISIVNKMLGYKITYYLNNFEYVKSESILNLLGNYTFKDTLTENNLSSFTDARNSTYLGSKMHFIRSVCNDDLKSSGFIIKNGNKKIGYKDIVRLKLSKDPKDIKKYIHYQGNVPITLTVLWKPGNSKSFLDIISNDIPLDETGYVDGSNIIWYGEMAKQGVADLLPYEFLHKKQKTE